jgi:serine phosphatase RsbU (regulator of sigma subunit)
MLTHLNRHLLDLRLEKYLTIFYGVIDIKSNHLDYSFGGHFPDPVMFDGTSARFLPGRGPPIGLFRGSVYDVESLPLPKRFALALFSDGILEVFPKMSLQQKRLRLLEAVDSIDSDADTLMANVGLKDGQSYPDDITLLLLKRNT